MCRLFWTGLCICVVESSNSPGINSENIKTSSFQEYYWIEEDVSVTEPTYYNVVYFEGRGDEVGI